MSRYEVVKFLHVLSVIVWVGGGVSHQLFAQRAARSGDPGEVVRHAKDAAWASNRLFMPASFAALGFGIWLVVDGPWSFGDLWIVLGLVGYGASASSGWRFSVPSRNGSSRCPRNGVATMPAHSRRRDGCFARHASIC